MRIANRPDGEDRDGLCPPAYSHWTRRKMNRLKDLIHACRNEVGVYRSVMADPRCPRVSRWLLGAAVMYALSPVDLIPDFIPVLGYIDDVLIVPLLVWLAMRLMPKQLIAEVRSLRAERTP